MITFKDFLTESRSAPLYHGTTLSKAIDIFNSNALLRSLHPERGIDKRTVSLTRNLTFALNWVEQSAGYGGGVIFVLNQNKISQRYKIQPYNYFGQVPDEVKRDSRFVRGLTARDFPVHRTFSKGKDYTFENQFEEAVLQDIKPIKPMIDKVLIMHTKRLAIEEDDFVMDLEQARIKVEFL